MAAAQHYRSVDDKNLSGGDKRLSSLGAFCSISEMCLPARPTGDPVRARRLCGMPQALAVVLLGSIEWSRALRTHPLRSAEARSGVEVFNGPIKSSSIERARPRM